MGSRSWAPYWGRAPSPRADVARAENSYRSAWGVMFPSAGIGRMRSVSPPPTWTFLYPIGVYPCGVWYSSLAAWSFRRAVAVSAGGSRMRTASWISSASAACPCSVSSASSAAAVSNALSRRSRDDRRIASTSTGPGPRAEPGLRAELGAEPRAELGAEPRAETGAEPRAETGADERAETGSSCALSSVSGDGFALRDGGGSSTVPKEEGRRALPTAPNGSGSIDV